MRSAIALSCLVALPFAGHSLSRVLLRRPRPSILLCIAVALWHWIAIAIVTIGITGLAGGLIWTAWLSHTVVPGAERHFSERSNLTSVRGLWNLLGHYDDHDRFIPSARFTVSRAIPECVPAGTAWEISLAGSATWGPWISYEIGKGAEPIIIRGSIRIPNETKLAGCKVEGPVNADIVFPVGTGEKYYTENQAHVTFPVTMVITASQLRVRLHEIGADAPEAWLNWIPVIAVGLAIRFARYLPSLLLTLLYYLLYSLRATSTDPNQRDE